MTYNLHKVSENFGKPVWTMYATENDLSLDISNEIVVLESTVLKKCIFEKHSKIHIFYWMTSSQNVFTRRDEESR